jgi:hypothetical protein
MAAAHTYSFLPVLTPDVVGVTLRCIECDVRRHVG